jgi:hypothetical protein
MAEIITHTFVSAKTQSPDTTLVSKNEWNDGHVFSGGINGQSLVYDDTQPNNMRWVNKTFTAFVADTVSSSTPTPLLNIASVSPTFETTVIALITYQAFSYTSVGNAVGTLSLVVDTLDVSLLNIPSPLIQATSATLPIPLPAGAHNINIRLNTAGNVNVTTLFISISIVAFGV